MAKCITSLTDIINIHLYATFDKMVRTVKTDRMVQNVNHDMLLTVPYVIYSIQI